MIEELILILVFGVFMELSFILGMIFSNKRNITADTPKIITTKIKKPTRAERKEIEKEIEIDEINLANIEAYDGTGSGQTDFPS